MSDHLLELEVATGQKYKQAWEETVEPFVKSKQAELFAAFLETNTSDSKTLLTLKLQCNALESLGDEFKSFINTGELARKQLEKEKNDGE